MGQRGNNVAEALGEFAVISALHVKADAGDENADDQDTVPHDLIILFVATLLQPLTGLVFVAVTLIVGAAAAAAGGASISPST